MSSVFFYRSRNERVIEFLNDSEVKNKSRAEYDV